MEILIIIILIIIVLSFIIFIYKNNKLLKELNEQKIQLAVQNEKIESQKKEAFNTMTTIQTNINGFRQEIASTLNTVNTTIDTKLNSVTTQIQSSNKIIGDVKERFGEIMETTKQIYNIGKDISSLENLLKAPKLRGNLGEFLLEDLLKQIIPSQNYAKQYKFKNGEKVDFVINLGEKFVPIDSKFPLENFRKALETEDENIKSTAYKEAIKNVKKHIDDISKKYINPSEGTYDFAMMYIPAENIYYEAIIKDESLKSEQSIYMYSIEKRVVPVSPNSMFAYLQSILIGLRGLAIEKNAETILNNIAGLRGVFERFSENFEKLGTHLSNAQKQYEESSKKLAKFENKLELVSPKKESESEESDTKLIE